LAPQNRNSALLEVFANWFINPFFERGAGDALDRVGEERTRMIADYEIYSAAATQTDQRRGRNNPEKLHPG
jgi:hypothetical protein